MTGRLRDGIGRYYLADLTSLSAITVYFPRTPIDFSRILSLLLALLYTPKIMRLSSSLAGLCCSPPLSLLFAGVTCFFVFSLPLWLSRPPYLVYLKSALKHEHAVFFGETETFICTGELSQMKEKKTRDTRR